MDYFNLLNEYNTHSSIYKHGLSSLHALHHFLQTIHTSLNEFISQPTNKPFNPKSNAYYIPLH